MKGYKGSENVLNSLQDSTASFIKSLLEELTHAYEKMRTLKSKSHEEISRLTEELEHATAKYEELKA